MLTEGAVISKSIMNEQDRLEYVRYAMQHQMEQRTCPNLRPEGVFVWPNTWSQRELRSSSGQLLQ
jgi:hypothetical protein